MRLTNIFILILLWVSVTPFIACSKKRNLGGSGNGVNGAGIQSTAGIVTGRELFTVMGTALNIDLSTDSNETTRILNDYFNYASSLPKYGDHGTGFSSIMSRLISNFAARTCTLGAQKDANSIFGNRVVYKFVDIKEQITSTKNSDPERWKAFTKHIAYRFWGMEAPEDELKVINDFVDTYKPIARSRALENVSGGFTANQTVDVAIMVCTLVGSSPRSFFKSER